MGTNPIEGVTVNGGALGITTTGLNGTYSFTNIQNGTSYSLRPTKTDATFVPEVISGTVTENVIANFVATANVVEPEPTHTHNPDPDSTQNTTTVSGYLTNNNIAISDAIVTLILPTNPFEETETITSSISVYKTTTDESGYYSLSNIPFGSYSLIAKKNDVILVSKSLTLNDTSNNITENLTPNAKSVLCSNVYGLWNGYLNMQNILELRNKGDSELVADIAVYASDFSVSNFTVRALHRLKIPKNEQRDLHINALSEFRPDTYGFIKITTNHNLFDGGVNYYRASSNVDSLAQFDYAFTIPLAETLSDKSFMLFNTYYPLTTQTNRVHNWLTVVNPNDTVFRADVLYYLENGELINTTKIKVPANSRLDIDGGHVAVGINKAGLIELVPQDATLAYISALIRYASDNSFAFGHTAKVGVSTNRILPITNLENRYGFFEVANTLNSTTSLNATWYKSDGTKAGDLTHRLKPKSIIHIPTDQLLPANTSGTLTFSSTTPQALIGQMAVYERGNSTFSFDEELSTVETTQVLDSYGTSLFGSYNLYLSSNNWLRVFNTTNENTTFTLSIADKEQTVTLRPHERRDIAIHELGLPTNTYGTLTLATQTNGGIVAQSLRVKTHEFITSAPVR